MDECPQVIAYCCYCREISPVEALDVFLGNTKKKCDFCREEENQQEDDPDWVPPAAAAT
jgi:hypothetical protein